MDFTISPRKLRGNICAIPSKSQAHRYLICSALAEKPTKLICPETNDDIEATVDCLVALGATITRTDVGYLVEPIKNPPVSAILNCRESGSTLRFLLSVAGALGVSCTFLLSGRLPQRPLSALWKELEKHGCALSEPNENTIQISGKLKAGHYQIDGSISSQYVSGLLLAFCRIAGKCTLEITGTLQSKPYVDMTYQALSLFQTHPESVTIEGDWSNSAFFIGANALGSDINISGLDSKSIQGDKSVIEHLVALENYAVIDAGNIPDLIPILAVVAGAKKGATFTNIERLRLKESNRAVSILSMLQALGCKVELSSDTLTVYPAPFQGCIIDSAFDHRIAMAGAIAATIANEPVTIRNAQCVSKSYPSFWEVYQKLGGKYEQYIR